MADTCSDLCGWTAALAALLADGTGSVPIKCERARRVDIDPLVFETYKRATYFALSWIVLLLGEPLKFTPWGIASGIMLVPGGMCGVYAVKNAGLAVSQGTWSSLKVLVSFVWGMFIFDEMVKSRSGACFSVLLIAIGLVGMSYFSSPEVIQQEMMPHHDEDNESPDPKQITNNLAEPLLSTEQLETLKPRTLSLETTPDLLVIKFSFTKRQFGLLCAVFDGMWGGSFLVPLHYSKYKGMGFIISEAFGAMIVVIFCWLVRLSYNSHIQNESYSKTYAKLPSMHFGTFWLPGILAGTLSTIANIGAVLATTALGYSVGYPISHSSLLVSGLFGIFVYKEVRGARNIAFWFAAALVTFSGMLLLSNMHEKASSPSP